MSYRCFVGGYSDLCGYNDSGLERVFDSSMRLESLFVIKLGASDDELGEPGAEE